MLERIFRSIILLFYKEWNTSSVKSFLLLLLVIAYGILNVIYGVNFLLEIVISLSLYIFLLFIKNIVMKEEDIIEEEDSNREKSENIKKETDITFITWFILIVIDLIISIGIPIYIFQAEYNWFWGLFFSLPVMIGCVIVNTQTLIAINEED